MTATIRPARHARVDARWLGALLVAGACLLPLGPAAAAQAARRADGPAVRTPVRPAAPTLRRPVVRVSPARVAPARVAPVRIAPAQAPVRPARGVVVRGGRAVVSPVTPGGVRAGAVRSGSVRTGTVRAAGGVARAGAVVTGMTLGGRPVVVTPALRRSPPDASTPPPAQVRSLGDLDGAYTCVRTDDAAGYLERLPGHVRARAVVLSSGQTGLEYDLVCIAADDDKPYRHRRWPPYYGFRRGFFGLGYWNTGWYWPYPWGPYWHYDLYDRYIGPIDGPVGFSTDTTAAPEPVELTALEYARLLMALDDASGAVEAYNSHLQANPADMDAMRDLGIALLEAGRTSDGVAVLHLVYATEPGLAGRAVTMDLFGNKTGRLRTLTQSVVLEANRLETAAGWLAAGVLIQARGLDEHAMRAIGKAADRGLDPAVVRAFAAALGG